MVSSVPVPTDPVVCSTGVVPGPPDCAAPSAPIEPPAAWADSAAGVSAMAAATIMAFRIEISSCTMLFNHSAHAGVPAGGSSAV